MQSKHANTKQMCPWDFIWVSCFCLTSEALFTADTEAMLSIDSNGGAPATSSNAILEKQNETSQGDPVCLTLSNVVPSIACVQEIIQLASSPRTTCHDLFCSLGQQCLQQHVNPVQHHSIPASSSAREGGPMTVR